MKILIKIKGQLFAKDINLNYNGFTAKEIFNLFRKENKKFISYEYNDSLNNVTLIKEK